MVAQLRGMIEIALAGVLIKALRLTRRRAGVAVVYHAVGFRQGDPGRELVPPKERSRFHRELRYMRRNFRPVPAGKFATSVTARRRLERFPVCVTFDDDLSSHFEQAFRPLTEEGVPATFFVCGASLQGPRSFWWERLQRAFDGGVPLRHIVDLLPPRAAKRLDGQELDIHTVAAIVKGLGPVERDEVDARLLEVAGPDPPESGLRTEAISALIAGGCAIGFHTRRHDELVQLNDRELEQALFDGRDELEALMNRPVDLIAYPHGVADRRVAEAASRAGFKSGFTARRCAMTYSADPMLIGRLGADNKRSLGEFALALSVTLLVGPTCEERAGG
jgi:peptidoglycan/xylan/chitin deacetylase (PgdA/CDA1 family)